MKTTKIIVSLAVSAAVLCAIGKAQAQVVQKLNISGTMTYQLPDSQKLNGNGSITTTYKTKKVSFNNNKLIAALNASTQFLTDAGISGIPNKSYLAMIGNDIIVTNKNGFGVNLSQIHIAGVGPVYASLSTADVEIASGNYNNASYKSSTKGVGANAEIDFRDGAGNSLVIIGLETFSENWAAKNSTDQQNVNQSGGVSGSGPGTTANSDAASPAAVVQGQASANGNAKNVPVSNL